MVLFPLPSPSCPRLPCLHLFPPIPCREADLKSSYGGWEAGFGTEQWPQPQLWHIWSPGKATRDKDQGSFSVLNFVQNLQFWTVYTGWNSKRGRVSGTSSPSDIWIRLWTDSSLGLQLNWLQRNNINKHRVKNVDTWMTFQYIMITSTLVQCWTHRDRQRRRLHTMHAVLCGPL